MLSREVVDSIIDTIESSRDGDQNATATIEETWKAADMGSERAKEVVGFIQDYTERHPASEFGADFDPHGASTSDFGAARRGGAPSHHPATSHHAPHQTAHREPARHVTVRRESARHDSHHGRHVDGRIVVTERGTPPRHQVPMRRETVIARQGGGGRSGGGGNLSSARAELTTSARSIAKKFGVDHTKLLQAASNSPGFGSDFGCGCGGSPGFGSQGVALSDGGRREMGILNHVAEAVKLSHGPHLTTEVVRDMSASFGTERARVLFLEGVGKPFEPVIPSPRLSRIDAACVRSGQCVGLASKYQIARMPGQSVAALSPLAAKELSPSITVRGSGENVRVTYQR